MMFKNFSELKRFDFTGECKTCPYCKDLGLMEYCCSFYLDFIKKIELDKLKRLVYDYIDKEPDLSIIDSDNSLFQNDTEFTVTLTFKTNLCEDKKLILKYLREAVMDSNYFNNVNFMKDSLIKTEFNKNPVILQSSIDEFIDNRVDVE